MLVNPLISVHAPKLKVQPIRKRLLTKQRSIVLETLTCLGFKNSKTRSVRIRVFHFSINA